MSQVKVVYIDDSQAVLAAVRDALKAAGYEIIVTETAEEAAPHCEGADVVVIDFNMPGTDGAEALTKIKASLGTRANDPRYYLYTDDVKAGVGFKEHGFDGLFIMKGDNDALVKQMDAVARTIKLQKLRTRAA